MPPTPTPSSPRPARATGAVMVVVGLGLLAAGLLSTGLLSAALLSPDLPSPAAELLSPEPALSPARFFLFPVLKSVSYQPPPFRRNTGAEIFFLRAGSPHFGQFSNGASLTFCRASRWFSQAWH